VSKVEAPRPPADIVERIAAARAGEERAFEDVIRHYQDRVAGHVVSLVGKDSADLDDLCQIVFLKMALSLPRLRSVDAFEPWLLTIARNVCRDHFRHLRLRKLFVPLSCAHETIPPDQQPEDPQAGLSTLDGALRKLSHAQRELINLLRGREYSYEELARVTKSSVRAVAGRLFRARARLRKLLRYNGADQ
jgi:RNA polymerase sigma-70 factor (ECF subfamily)